VFLIPFWYANIKSEVGKPTSLAMLELVTKLRTPSTTRELIECLSKVLDGTSVACELGIDRGLDVLLKVSFSTTIMSLVFSFKSWKLNNGVLTSFYATSRIRSWHSIANQWKIVCFLDVHVETLLWKSVDETHTSEIGTWESSGTPETLEFDCRGQNTSHWCVLHIIESLSKCRCQKWPRMGHLDICSISYGTKKGRESNSQFDSRPLKVWNRPDPGVCGGVWYTVEKLLRRATSLL
jgi:hypothetical protein